MMTSGRLQDVGSSFANRKGHASQLSISDPSHHVTEAIGTMYTDGDDSGAEDNRPLSFLGPPKLDTEHLNSVSNKQQQPGDSADTNRLRLVRTTSDQSSIGLNTGNGFALRKSQTFPARMPMDRNNSNDGPRSPLSPLSPTPSLRDVQADESQFPTNIDNPNDIAQELSNLQALRRMSMDVGNHTRDPDLLPFSGVSLMAMPSIAPTGDDDEADPSRLLWVPARVHPELEPTAFKNFLENRVQTMKRRSGDSFLSADGLQGGNAGSLRRKKSMLSRQVNPNSDSAEGDTNGTDRLKRQGSLGEYATPELSLNELVKDPTKVVQKLAQETMAEGGSTDNPILPVAPGMGLRRSTKTTYRKGGSQRYGDRAPFAKRVAGKHGEKESSEEAPPVPSIDPAIKPLTRVNSEPIAQNYSRPKRTVRRQQNFSRDLTESDGPTHGDNETPEPPASPPSPQKLPVRSASTTETRTYAPPSRPAPPVPQIVETPPVEEPAQPAQTFPQRSSSQKGTSETSADQPPVDGPPARSSKRPAPNKPVEPPAPAKPPQVEAPTVAKEKVPSKENPLSQISQPAALPGSAGSTTSSLTFVPTFDNVEKKPDRRSKDKDETASMTSTKSTSSWKWFKSGDKDKKKKEKEREEEREREAEREREEQAKKAKSKAADKSHDNARLDVLQNSIDSPKGRESLRLDRDSIELPPEKTPRKSSDSKKERDGFFGGLFGGSKKKGEKEPGHKKKEHRPLTPEPPQRPLIPDQDYHWTRFPIIEERAIYRMAHIKLANPRRPLHSQVLLSNFMYSYLAKVQAMHPQLNVPISPQQKRLEEERKRREAEQQRQQQLELEQQMAAQQAAQDGNYNFDYHRSGNQYGDSPVHDQDGSVQYVDDSQIYEYEHGDGDKQQRYQSDAGSNNNSHQQQQQQQSQARDQNYHYARGETSRFDDDDDNEMW